MRKILFFLTLLTVVSCKKDSDPAPTTNSGFAGKYFYSVKEHQVGDWGAFDIIITVTEKSGKYNVNVVDDIVDPTDMGEAVVSGNTLTVKQHVHAGYDTRDITLSITNDDGIYRLEYEADFTEASGDFYLNEIITKQK